MTETTAYVSPNGEPMHRGSGPATRLMVATIEGVATYTREGQGAPWRLSGRTLTERHVGSLLFEPVSGRLFAGAHDGYAGAEGGGVWVSEDGSGASWRELSKGLDRSHVYCLARCRVGERTVLLAGTEPAALYRSDNLGESWTELASLREVPEAEKWIFPPPPHIAHAKEIVCHPDEPGTIYVLVEQGALLRTKDGGNNWVELKGYSRPDDSAYRDVHRLVIDPGNPGNMYLATGEGFYASADAGESWEHLMKPGDRIGYPDFLFLDPNDDKTLYMAGARKDPGTWFGPEPNTDAAVMRSADGGRTWSEVGSGLPSPFVPAIEGMCLYHWPGGAMFAMASATGEVYTSEDGCASWTPMEENIPPVSKDHHHLPWFPKEVVDEEIATRLVYAKQHGIDSPWAS